MTTRKTPDAASRTPEDAEPGRESPAIDVGDVSVTLGSTPVLEDVSMTVERGEFVGLVGPNGAGKTTLLQCITGIRTPEEGTIRIGDSPLSALDSREISRRVAVVPQDTTLDFDFSVRDVVAMGRTPHRGRFERASDDDRRIVEDALARTNVRSLADSSIRAVSGGERQRVVLARALAQEAQVLLLDEPTASLDVNHQIHTLDIVDDLVGQGRTAVAAIHDLSLAARYCDRLVLITDGEIVTAGPPERVLTRGAVTAAFDADAAVTIDPVTGTPAVTPLSAPADELEASVHVVGTGSAASETVTTLAAAGATVTVGPVPPGDAVATAANGVDVDPVTSPPFSPPGDAARSAIETHAARADLVVLAGSIPLAAMTTFPAETDLVAIPPVEFASNSRSQDDDRTQVRLDEVTRVAPADLDSAIESNAGVSISRVRADRGTDRSESHSRAEPRPQTTSNTRSRDETRSDDRNGGRGADHLPAGTRSSDSDDD